MRVRAWWLIRRYRGVQRRILRLQTQLDALKFQLVWLAWEGARLGCLRVLPKPTRRELEEFLQSLQEAML